MNVEKTKARAAFVGFGEVNTPREFIDSRCAAAAGELEAAGLELVRTAPVADDPAGAQAARAAAELAAADFDALIVCVAGWIPSWAVFSVIERFRHKPIVLLGLTGWQAGGRFVTTADQAGTTALRRPMAEMGYRFKYVVNYRGQPLPAGEVVSWCRAASAAARLRGARIGMAGYRDMRLYGTLYDGVSLKGMVGPEIEHFDLLELQALMDALPAGEVETLARAVEKRWVFLKPPRPETVARSVRFCLAVGRKVRERGYAAFSYSDVDGVKKLMGFAPAGALTLFHQEFPGVPTIPENDALGAVSQLLVHYLTGQAAAYLEFYEFLPDGALMGVPDYVPAEIVDGPVTVTPNAFGAFGEGLLNVSKLKTGRVTICRLARDGVGYALHLAAGEARAPAPWEEAGWAPPAPQLPGLEIIFDGAAAGAFAQNVMGQHYILAYGDHRAALRDLCAVLGVRVL